VILCLLPCLECRKYVCHEHFSVLGKRFVECLNGQRIAAIGYGRDMLHHEVGNIHLKCGAVPDELRANLIELGLQVPIRLEPLECPDFLEELESLLAHPHL
jgi:hypothetical protein